MTIYNEFIINGKKTVTDILQVREQIKRKKKLKPSNSNTKFKLKFKRIYNL